jgi:hypothetical protein
VSTPERVRALVAGLVAGFAGGLFGVGGGIVLVPMLTGWLALTQHQAHGTSLAAIGATAIAGLAVYGSHGNVAWWTALPVGVASALGARWGARLAARLNSAALARVFAAFLVLVAARILWPQPAGGIPALESGPASLAFDVALGVAVGVLAGFMGVGGGILAVPAFALVLGMPQPLAQGTSLAVILLAAPTGAIEHARHGNLVGRLIPWLASGAALGGAATSWLVQGAPQHVLSRGFAAFLIANAAHTWWRAARAPRPPK